MMEENKIKMEEKTKKNNWLENLVLIIGGILFAISGNIILICALQIWNSPNHEFLLMGKYTNYAVASMISGGAMFILCGFLKRMRR